MSLHRVLLAGLAAAFTVGMTSMASAGGWGWGSGWGGWGGGWGGCGTCGSPSAAVVFAQPVAPLPPPPPPAGVGWTTGCGCHSVVFAPPFGPALEPTPIAPAPIYVVNQGPEYSGPGIMVPYHTWRPTPGYGPAFGYPHRPHFGYGYHYRYGVGFHGWRYPARLAYHRPFIGHPYRPWPMPLGRYGYPWNK
jgi:hypothetical protein